MAREFRLVHIAKDRLNIAQPGIAGTLLEQTHQILLDLDCKSKAGVAHMGCLPHGETTYKAPTSPT